MFSGSSGVVKKIRTALLTLFYLFLIGLQYDFGKLKNYLLIILLL